MPGNSASCSSFQATSSAPVRSTGMPTRSAYSDSSSEPARHEPRLERARLGVEAGVEQRGVRLARAGPHVRPGLEQGHPQVEARQLARDRAADHARADDGDVGVERLLHGRQYRVGGRAATGLASQRACAGLATTTGQGARRITSPPRVSRGPTTVSRRRRSGWARHASIGASDDHSGSACKEPGERLRLGADRAAARQRSSRSPRRCTRASGSSCSGPAT